MTKIPLKTLHQTVAERIYQMIIKGELSMGQKLIEAELCDTLGVSRTPLREALRSLSSEGLIELIPNKGAFIRKPSIDEIREMFEAMSILEGLCGRIALDNMTARDLQKLEEFHERLEEQYAVQDIKKYAQTNLKFHTYLREMLNNETLGKILNGLRRKILMFRYRQLYLNGRFDESIKEHRHIIQAFRKRDPFAVEHAMKLHLINQCERLVEMYQTIEGSHPTDQMTG
jgi:DNA-binding GntR family transcriptional regulator